MRSARRPAAATSAFALLLLAACGAGKPEPSPSPSGVGAQVKGMEQDMGTMREAIAAANDVIRASGDCDAARPLIAAANSRLDEAARKIQTGAGQQTLDALRKKVKDVADGCP
jgi:outer membrane murein-binding lipoprotein Lpp